MTKPTEVPVTVTGTPDQPAALVPAGPRSPLALIELALEKGAAIDQLGKLLDMQERWEKAEAARQFAVAVTGFQAECQPVFKRRLAKIKTDRAEYGYRFASYDDVMETAGPLLQAHGIAISFSTEQSGAQMKVTCRVRVGTHVEDTCLQVPIPQMSVNDTQKFGAALSYAKRYALCAALNIVVTDEDPDATGLIDRITGEQIAELNALLEKKGVFLARFLEWAQVDSLDLIPVRDFPKAKAILTNKPDLKAGGKK